MKEIKQERIRRWTLAVLWTALIYATLYIMRPICDYLSGYSWFVPFINATIILSVIFVIVFSIKKRFIRKKSSYFLLLPVLAIYYWRMFSLTIAAERVHLIEYGILAFLIYRALRIDFKSGPAYILSFVATSLIGLGDEGIQYLLPNRFYQFRDVCLNSVSAALGLALVYCLNGDKNI